MNDEDIIPVKAKNKKRTDIKKADESSDSGTLSIKFNDESTDNADDEEDEIKPIKQIKPTQKYRIIR